MDNLTVPALDKSPNFVFYAFFKVPSEAIVTLYWFRFFQTQCFIIDDVSIPTLDLFWAFLFIGHSVTVPTLDLFWAF